jgi:hypothetical protein
MYVRAAITAIVVASFAQEPHQREHTGWQVYGMISALQRPNGFYVFKHPESLIIFL